MKKFLKFLLPVCLLAFSPSCTDLDETLYSTLEADNFYKSEQECILAMGNAYTTMQYRGSSMWGLFGSQTLSTDEAVAPYRNQGTFLRNNGIWINTHQHDFLPTIAPVFASWEFCFYTISACNQIIYQIDKAPVQFDKKPNVIAELKVLRDFAYYKAMDLFGNIPVVLDFTDTSLPVQKTRAEAFAIVEQEIKDNIDLLDPLPSPENYGRCTQGMAYTLLAKLYLNSDKWLGEPRWEEAIEMCDKVINSEGYKLEGNYFDNFIIENQNSGETIFAMPYDRRQGWGWQLHSYTLNPAQADMYNYSAPIWNGVTGLEAFYDRYDAEDSRINSWLAGPQTDFSGQPILGTDEQQLVFSPHINGLTTAGEGDGVRCNKWEFPRDLQQNESMDNDWIFFRLADVLLMKAEALMRANGGVATGEAVDLVNQVRERAFGNSEHNYSTSTLTLDELLNERGRELAWEGQRRQDLIRFGKWEDAWFEKPAEPDTHSELLPIPSTALAANPNLEQNPGY